MPGKAAHTAFHAIVTTAPLIPGLALEGLIAWDSAPKAGSSIFGGVGVDETARALLKKINCACAYFVDDGGPGNECRRRDAGQLGTIFRHCATVTAPSSSVLSWRPLAVVDHESLERDFAADQPQPLPFERGSNGRAGRIGGGRDRRGGSALSRRH